MELQQLPARLVCVRPLSSSGVDNEPNVHELFETTDWRKTGLGPRERWPMSLQVAVEMCRHSLFPCVIYWGPEYLHLFNQPWCSILGGKDIRKVFAAPGRIVWAEVWEVLSPMLDQVRATGIAMMVEDYKLMMTRNGYLEETYFSWSYSPLMLPDLTVGGIFSPVMETTHRILGERRLKTLSQLALNASKASTQQEACRYTTDTLAGAEDIVFAIIYLCTDDQEAEVVATTFEGNQFPSSLSLLLPARVLLGDRDGCTQKGNSWHSDLVDILQGGEDRVIDYRDHSDHVRQVLMLPMKVSYHPASPVGVFIAGINPYRALDEKYREWFDLVVGKVSIALTNTKAFEEEQRRIEKLAQLDRAKNIFFSHTSHEFRTPLTLMLSPLEEILQDPALSEGHRELLDIIIRSAHRLRRLVTHLLDFSAIEEGRNTALYRPTQLSKFTRVVTSLFEYAASKLGLRLVIDCPAEEDTGEPAMYVDRAMWQKVVLNLLSNALKYTWEGHVRISYRQVSGGAELVVSDTGIGIAEEDIPRIFERFFEGRRRSRDALPVSREGRELQHREGRSQEGTRIGLPLTKELVRLHGGEITVTSTLGEGSSFRVFIPAGRAHLRSEQVAEHDAPIDHAKEVEDSLHYTDELLSWVKQDTHERSSGNNSEAEVDFVSSTTLPCSVQNQDLDSSHNASNGETSLAGRYLRQRSSKPSVLLVDDNIDLLHYVSSLLAPGFHVQTATDGAKALRMIMSSVKTPNPDRSSDAIPMPDLILSDVMMPVMDGFALIRALRNDPLTAGIPIILISARAGPEASVEGLDVGADDYLAKPFSAQELLAKVKSTIRLRRMRKLLLDVERGEIEHQFLVSSILERMRAGGTSAMTGVIDDSLQRLGDLLRTHRILLCRFDNPPSLPPASSSIAMVYSCSVVSEQRAPAVNEEFMGRRFEVSGEAGSLVTLSINPEIGTQKDFLTDCAKSLDRSGYRSCVAAIWVGDHVWGFMHCLRHSEFSPADILLVREVCEHIGHGLSQARLLEKQKEQNAELQATIAANKNKNMMLAKTSHELRTPLNAIIGLTDLLLDNRLSPDQEDMIRLVHSSSELLREIVNDILDYSKIEAKQLILHEKEFDVVDTLQEILDMLSEPSGQKDIELALMNELPVGFPTRLIGDPARLQQVVVNLVNNAIKFTPQGGEVVLTVTVAEATEGETTPDVYLKVDVSDTGIGISEEDARELFRPFSQVDTDSRVVMHHGTGLGLAISKMLVELASGAIGVSSRPGDGSHFWFTWLCRRLADSPDPKELKLASVLPFRMLIVDHTDYVKRNIQSFFGELCDCCQVRSLDVAEAVVKEAVLEGREFGVILLFTGIEEDAEEVLNTAQRLCDSTPAVRLVLSTLPDRAHHARARLIAERLGRQRVVIVTKPLKRRMVLLCSPYDASCQSSASTSINSG